MEKTMDINDLWNYGGLDDWKKALVHYDEVLSEEDREKEDKIYGLISKRNFLSDLNGKEFYDFLYEDYFVWKYTQKNRLARNRNLLSESYNSEKGLVILNDIKTDFLQVHEVIPKNTRANLFMLMAISGIGVAGASGLLSLLYPEDYGTVDVFLVEEIKTIEEFFESDGIRRIKGSALEIMDGVLLEEILRDKAKQLNTEFETDIWTPRKIDQVLWSNHID